MKYLKKDRTIKFAKEAWKKAAKAFEKTYFIFEDACGATWRRNGPHFINSYEDVCQETYAAVLKANAAANNAKDIYMRALYEKSWAVNAEENHK